MPCLAMGGTEKQLLYLVSNLDTRCFDPVVWLGGEWGPVADLLKEAGIPIFQVPFDENDAGSIERVISWMRGLNADIFHAFSYGYEWFDILFARLAGIPVCISRRGNARHWDPDGVTSLPEHLRNIGSDLVVANSRFVAGYCEQVEGVPREKIRVVYNGVDLPGAPARKTARQALGNTDGEFVLGNVANLKPVKGQDYLLRAFRQVLCEVPQARLVICGEGRARPDLESLRDALDLGDRVTFLGQRLDVEQVYAALDLYVHSSLSEGFSNAIVEAMLSGLPVVATAAGGAPEAVVEGVTGTLVPPGDPESLARGILRLGADGPKRQGMGKAGRKRATECFSVARMVSETQEIYLEGFRLTPEDSSTSGPGSGRSRHPRSTVRRRAQ